MPVSVLNVLPRFNRDSPEDGDHTGFQYQTKPFIICLKLTGLHHLTFPESERRKTRRRLSHIYRGFVPGLLMVNFIFSLGEFINVHGFDGALLNNLISSIWFLQVTCFSLNNAFRCWRWERFYQNWNKFTDDYKLNFTTRNRKIATLAVICFIVWILIATAFMAINISAPRPPSGFMIYMPAELSIVVTIITVVAYMYFVSTWFLLTTQFVMICISICSLLQDLHQAIKERYENAENLSETIETFRRQHDKICVMISLTDDILTTFIMVTVSTTIPLIVLTLYFVIFVTAQEQAFSYVATWWSISLSTLQLALVFLFGGAVNYMAHKSTELLYRLDLNGFSQKSIVQLNVFLNRLTSLPIGLTACGMFVLDKPTIVTFVGSIATYAIVMIQFKPGDNSCNTVCPSSRQHYTEAMAT